MREKKKRKAIQKRASKEAEELKNQLARALADYDNLRKRVETERENFKKIANLTLIIRLLPIFDMLEEAQEQLRDPGLAIIIKEFTEVLKEESIERIDAAKGVEFNEDLHEAVEVVEKGAEEGQIVECVLAGWKYKEGLVIRPAKVKVKKSK